MNIEKISEYTVICLYVGYSNIDEASKKMSANCSCTLIKGPKNIIVDTMTPWDGDKILTALEKYDLKPNDIHYVISTHGHSDHTGNNNLFLSATHIVGTSVNKKDEYELDAFENGASYRIDDSIEVICTPGHTLSDVSVIVRTVKDGVFAIAGDLFERAEDVDRPDVWLSAGSEDADSQRRNRHKICTIADWIIPGHGGRFRCTDDVRNKLRSQMEACKK